MGEEVDLNIDFGAMMERARLRADMAPPTANTFVGENEWRAYFVSAMRRAIDWIPLEMARHAMTKEESDTTAIDQEQARIVGAPDRHAVTGELLKLLLAHGVRSYARGDLTIEFGAPAAEPAKPLSAKVQEAAGHAPVCACGHAVFDHNPACLHCGPDPRCLRKKE